MNRSTINTLIATGGAVIAAIVLAVALYAMTDPHRGKDFSRLDNDKPIILTTLEPVLPGYNDYERQLTDVRTEQQRQTLEALLCSMGETEYCD